jgi:hypothetical protein
MDEMLSREGKTRLRIWILSHELRGLEAQVFDKRLALDAAIADYKEALASCGVKSDKIDSVISEICSGME